MIIIYSLGENKMIICICSNISENQIKLAIQNGCNDMHLLCKKLDMANVCGKCKSCTKKILREQALNNSHRK